eukprot:TRINITY_DN6660_c0_g3_i1.p1 TRINITY_DN6660_c0_g3~~TRINITY_DN6660_c0_g3_i1.p1  ORF type:complete len:311 (+),score=47.48 TRINITY_DN6660_c0_g3_i1:74-1006(+)
MPERSRISLPRAPPPVYIPSKGRCWKVKGTVTLMASEGIPATVVVEPEEYEEYKKWLSGSSVSLLQLPKSGMGVCYCRNFILDAAGDGWFWIMDDDIQSFHTNGVERSDPTTLITAKEVLNIVHNLDPITKDEKVALVGLEYRVFSNSRGKLAHVVGEYQVDSYVNVCAALNKQRLPPGIRYHFNVREDYDFALQVIYHGLTTLRLKWMSFNAPSMGTLAGGMYDYYSNERACIAQATVFSQKWNKTSERVMKGPAGNKRPDLRVKWSSLKKLMPLQREYNQTLEAERSKASGDKKRRKTEENDSADSSN